MPQPQLRPQLIHPRPPLRIQHAVAPPRGALEKSIPSISVPSLASARFFPGQFVPALPANSPRALPKAITLDIDLFIIRTRQKDQYELALERIIFPGKTLPSAEYLSGN